MSEPSAEAFIDAFTSVVREQLADGESVSVPKLGTLTVEHEPSERRDLDDGPPVLTPPRNIVRFDPDA